MFNRRLTQNRKIFINGITNKTQRNNILGVDERMSKSENDTLFFKQLKIKNNDPELIRKAKQFLNDNIEKYQELMKEYLATEDIENKQFCEDQIHQIEDSINEKLRILRNIKEKMETGEI
jgi:hypothetical protein